MDAMKSFSELVRELQERRVFRVASVYVVTTWIFIQGAIDLFPVFGIPEWATRLLVIVGLVGFPIAIILAWAYQVTGDGVVREPEHTARASRGVRWQLDFVVIGALVLLAGFLVFRNQLLELVDFDGRTETTASSTAPAEARPARELHPQSIAVLPFVNMSSDRDTEYFSDGITEELLNVLANIPGLRVASRTSSFAFKDSQADIPTVSDKLGVAFVLEGSVRRSGERVRITAQLIDAREDVHLWSETYDRELLEIFAIQDEISGVIVDRLKPTVLAARGGQRTAATTHDAAAYDLYLHGLSAYRPDDPAALDQSIDFLQRSLERDDGFARAWSALSRAQLSRAELGDKESDFAAAERSAREALRRDDRLREAHEVLMALQARDNQ